MLQSYYNRSYRSQLSVLKVEGEEEIDVEHEKESEDGEPLDEKIESKHKPLRQKDKDIKFEGGKVIEPTRGEHRNVIVLDVASLYPTVIINHNMSLILYFVIVARMIH